MNQSAIGACGETALRAGCASIMPDRSVEARIRDAPHSDSAVVVRHVFDQPINGVVGVGALVDVGWAAFLRLVRADIYELAFGHEPPAHILIDEDVTFLLKQGRRTYGILEGIFAVWPNTIGSTEKHYRIFLRGVSGRVDTGEELDSVTHCNLVFRLRVSGATTTRSWAPEGPISPASASPAMQTRLLIANLRDCVIIPFSFYNCFDSALDISTSLHVYLRFASALAFRCSSRKGR